MDNCVVQLIPAIREVRTMPGGRGNRRSRKNRSSPKRSRPDPMVSLVGVLRDFLAGDAGALARWVWAVRELLRGDIIRPTQGLGIPHPRSAAAFFDKARVPIRRRCGFR